MIDIPQVLSMNFQVSNDSIGQWTGYELTNMYYQYHKLVLLSSTCSHRQLVVQYLSVSDYEGRHIVA